MEPIEYLRALRRRWVIVVGALLLALTVAWSTTAIIPVGPPIRSYEATVGILNTGPLNVPGISTLSTVAALTTIGDVPVRVAERLGFEGDPVQLAARVRAFAEGESGILRITATGQDSRETKKLADAFAEELLGFLSDRKAETIALQAQFLGERLEQLQAETDALDNQIAVASAREAQFLSAERDAKIQIYGVLSQQYNALVFSAADPGTLLIVQRASPQEIVQTGFQPPRSRTGRMILAGILGLFAGLGIALLLERIDTRIRTKEAAERHFGLPVLSEIPTMPRDGIITSAQPTSRPADAFRLLAASLARAPILNVNGAKDATLRGGADGVRAILVTSAVPGEGKSCVVANLGVAFSQMGIRVLILSCDFRHPTIHGLFGLYNEAGLADALQNHSDGQAILDRYVQDTPHPGVRLVPSGSSTLWPATLLTAESMHRALEEARGACDVVLLDTPAVLRASDAAHLIEQVDAVLLVARAGRTTVEQAERARDVLSRLEAPVIGVALNEAPSVALRTKRLSRLL